MRPVDQDGIRTKSCPHCAYDTRGNSGSTCPECGEDIRKLPHASIRKVAFGMLAVTGLAALLCFLLRRNPGDAYLLLVIAYLVVCVNSFVLPALIVLNAVRRRQDGCDSPHQRMIDGLFILAGWAEFGFASMALHSGGGLSIFHQV